MGDEERASLQTEQARAVEIGKVCMARVFVIEEIIVGIIKQALVAKEQDHVICLNESYEYNRKG